MELALIPISSDCFTSSIRKKRLTAFRSDLPGNNAPQEQLYDDACDTGLAIVSSKSGRVTRWYFDKHVFDREGDLIETLYKPTTETLRKFPRLDSWVLYIGND